MVLNLFKELIQYEEIGGDMVQRIKDLSVYNIFKPLAEDENYLEGEKFNKVLWWILYCYSKDSTKDILGVDWETVKLTVAKDLKFTKDLIHPVTTLADLSIRETIMNYLEYQDYRVYKHLKVLKDQYHEMLFASLQPLKSGEAIDYSMKYKCGEYADKLLDRIKFYEDKLKDDNRDIKEAIFEIEKKQGRTLGTSLSVDTNEAIEQ